MFHLVLFKSQLLFSARLEQAVQVTISKSHYIKLALKCPWAGKTFHVLKF